MLPTLAVLCVFPSMVVAKFSMRFCSMGGYSIVAAAAFFPCNKSFCRTQSPARRCPKAAQKRYHLAQLMLGSVNCEKWRRKNCVESVSVGLLAWLRERRSTLLLVSNPSNPSLNKPGAQNRHAYPPNTRSITSPSPSIRGSRPVHEYRGSKHDGKPGRGEGT